MTLDTIKKAALKGITFSLQAIFLVSVLGVLYGSIKAGELNFSYVVQLNFLVGIIIITTGIVRMILPERSKNKRLVDHSNMLEVFLEKREEKRSRANGMILSGMLYISMTAVIQLILSLIIW